MRNLSALILAVMAVSAVPQAQSTASQCTVEQLGSAIPTSAVGLPVRSVTLSPPVWVDAANGVPAHCRVDGVMAPIDTAPTARPINFRVLLPASMLVGAIFMLWTDTAARSLFDPRELPVGIVTALVGAPAFLLILLRYRRIT